MGKLSTIEKLMDDTCNTPILDLSLYYDDLSTSLNVRDYVSVKPIKCKGCGYFYYPNPGKKEEVVNDDSADEIDEDLMERFARTSRELGERFRRVPEIVEEEDDSSDDEMEMVKDDFVDGSSWNGSSWVVEDEAKEARDEEKVVEANVLNNVGSIIDEIETVKEDDLVVSNESGVVEDEVKEGRNEGKGKELNVLGNQEMEIEVIEARKEEKRKEVDVWYNDDLSIEEMDIGKEEFFVYEDQWNEGSGCLEDVVYGKPGVENYQASNYLPLVNMEDLGLERLSLVDSDLNKRVKLLHEQLVDSARKLEAKLQEFGFAIQLEEQCLQWDNLFRPQKKEEPVKEVPEAFVPLSDEDMSEIKNAFANSNRRNVLVSHEKSGINITGEILQCLGPGASLNDEVINLYLELLKERENSNPQKFLKCHFFNTFFYKKLIGGEGGYNFQAVRRWTSKKKLGYCLSDCDKIFVPIHKKVHWCLAVINKKDQKFQYLDSLGQVDDEVMKVLARYYVDEMKEKTDTIIDVSSWGQEYVDDLPEQENGFDCGVFTIKYADFYSRGVGLHFKQEHIPYFRLRTAKEILKLKAE